jgi:PrtD family type I secretion system ABC transporter
VPKILASLRPYFACAALFSVVINLLLLAAPLYMLQVFDRVLASRSSETLVMLSVAALVAIGVGAMLDIVRARLLAAAGMALERSLAPAVLERLGGLREVHALRMFLAGPGVLALFDAPWLPAFLLLIALFHPLLGLLAFAGAAAMVITAVLNERLTRGPLERGAAESSRAGRLIDSGLRNGEALRALGMHGALIRRWAAINDGALAEQVRGSSLGAFFAGLSRFLRQFIQMAMLALGAWLVIEQNLTAGVMMAATIILGRALAPVETLVAGWRNLVEARVAWRKLRQQLDARGEAVQAMDLPAPAGRIAVEGAVVIHPGAEQPALRNVTFSVAAGEALGIIGPNSAGKSTLVRLLVGIDAPRAGSVRLDGAEISSWPRERLGPHLGYLPQDVQLFAGTVAQNIARLGDPDPAAVVRAAQRARIHELVLRLPQGYDTEVGEAGQRLSGGVRRRIGLARALYGEPRLVVLDEPNADLDHAGDEALVAALRELKAQGVTTVVVAHRPSLLAGMDKLLVLRDGGVDMFGPRGEVMGRYALKAA